MREWWRKMCKRWDEFKLKHPLMACLLQYGGLALLVVLVGHLVSSMANIVYFRYPFDDFGYPFNFSYPFNETFRHSISVTANLTITNATEMYADNARSILCTLVASEAAIVAIVVSLTLIAVEFTASEYSPRVIDISLKNPDMWILLLIYGISIFYALVLIKQVPHDSWIPFEDVSLAFWLGIFSYVALVPYLVNTIQLLKPTNIVRRVSEDIVKDNILTYNKDLESGNVKNDKENPIQPILDIIYRSVNNYDLETVRKGLGVIAKDAEKVIGPCPFTRDSSPRNDNEKLLNSKEKQMSFSTYFCDPLKRIIRLAASKDDEGSTIEVIKTLQTFGEKTADKKLNVATEQVAVTLGAVGKISVEKGKAFEDAVNQVVESLEEVGKAAADEGLEEATEKVASSLRNVGNAAVTEGLEEATEKVVSSLKAVGIAAAEKELGGATVQVVSSLEAVGKAVAKKKLGETTEQVAETLGALGNKAAEAGGKLTNAVLQAVFSLEAVGTTAAEKGIELENATQLAALYIENVGETAVKNRKELENVTGLAATSLGNVGKAAAEAELEKATKYAATYLGALLKTAMGNNLEGVIKKATKSLLAVGTTILEKKGFENAIDEVVEYLNDLKTSNVNIFETIIHDYESELKKPEECNTFKKFKNRWQD